MEIRIKENKNQTDSDKSRVLLLLPNTSEATAEDMSMLQALYSRDPRPIDDAVKLAKSSKSGEFMNKFYVGYGHSSIAECGNITLAIENVPMIIAKLIQHNQLYRGQESSTRYLDFSKQTLVSPSKEGYEIQEQLRQFYIKWMPFTIDEIAYKNGLDQNNPTEAKIAKTAAFDVMRGFLPIGTCTNLSWTTDLKNFNDHISRLRSVQDEFYGLKDLLDKMVSLVSSEFPNSIFDKGATKFEKVSDIKEKDLPIPTKIKLSTGQHFIEYTNLMDFASWRDFARHRSIYQLWPEFKTNQFEGFYIDNVAYAAMDELNAIISRYNEKEYSIYDYPMGIAVRYYFSGYSDKLDYILNLRSSKTVHPSLRYQIISMAEKLNMIDSIKEENRNAQWILNPKRALQDIELK